MRQTGILAWKETYKYRIRWKDSCCVCLWRIKLNNIVLWFYLQSNNFLINHFSFFFFSFFADRESERRDTAGDGANAASSAEPSVTQNQQQTVDSDTTRRVTPLPDLIPVTHNISAPSEAPVPPPRRGTPSDGVRPPRPPPRRPRRRRSTCCDDKTPVVPTDHRTCEDWQSIGKQLRKIADSFRGSGLEVGEWHTTVSNASACMSCSGIQRMKCF